MSRGSIKASTLSVFFIVLYPFLARGADEICIFSSSDGKLVQVNSRAQVPIQYRNSANCFKAKKSSSSESSQKRETWAVSSKSKRPISLGGEGSRSDDMAKPSDVNLSGTIRKEDMASSLGRIELRWPRKRQVWVDSLVFPLPEDLPWIQSPVSLWMSTH